MDKEYIDINKEFKETLEWLKTHGEVYEYIDIYNVLEECYEENIIEYFGLSLEIEDGRWPVIYEVEMMMLHLLMFRFSTGRLLDNWCFKIYLARYELREITGWDMKNNSYNKEDIVKYIIDSYDEIYRNAVEDYIIKEDLDFNLIYGTSYFPKTCPWSLQDLIKAPYRDLIKMIHDPKDDEDAARLITRCKFLDSLRFVI